VPGRDRAVGASGGPVTGRCRLFIEVTSSSCRRFGFMAGHGAAIVLQALDLTKRYNGQMALDRLNLFIQPGEVFRLLGAIVFDLSDRRLNGRCQGFHDRDSAAAFQVAKGDRRLHRD
jgi:hypothetical protein